MHVPRQNAQISTKNAFYIYTSFWEGIWEDGIGRGDGAPGGSGTRVEEEMGGRLPEGGRGVLQFFAYAFCLQNSGSQWGSASVTSFFAHFFQHFPMVFCSFSRMRYVCKIREASGDRRV